MTFEVYKVHREIGATIEGLSLRPGTNILYDPLVRLPHIRKSDDLGHRDNTANIDTVILRTRYYLGQGGEIEHCIVKHAQIEMLIEKGILIKEEA